MFDVKQVPQRQVFVTLYCFATVVVQVIDVFVQFVPEATVVVAAAVETDGVVVVPEVVELVVVVALVVVALVVVALVVVALVVVALVVVALVIVTLYMTEKQVFVPFAAIYEAVAVALHERPQHVRFSKISTVPEFVHMVAFVVQFGLIVVPLFLVVVALIVVVVLSVCRGCVSLLSGGAAAAALFDELITHWSSRSCLVRKGL